jgi:hypothetical protein
MRCCWGSFLNSPPSRARIYSTSSLRTQGPIHRVACFERRYSTAFAPPLTPVVMGPCVRRDDIAVSTAIQASNSQNFSTLRHGRASSRPSTSVRQRQSKTWMPGSSPGMTIWRQSDNSDTPPHSRDAESARAMHEFVASRKQRAQGKPGAQLAPAASRAKIKKHTSVVAEGTAEITRPSLRNGFNGFLRALPGDRAFLSPSLADNSANLTPASRRQDHTTSPSASRIIRPATLSRA